jgi:hypothetical protein
MFDRGDIHAPVTGVGQGMEVAIIHERFQIYFEGTASPQKRVLNDGGIFALTHPNTLFQKCVAQCVSPHWRRAF